MTSPIVNEAEEGLPESEDRLRLIIDTIPAMAWTVRPDGVVDFIHERWRSYTGMSLEEELEEHKRVVHPEDRPRVMEKWLADVDAGVPYEDEMRLLGADGKYRWFLIRTVPLRDGLGNIVKWFGTSTEIDTRKQAEDALRSSLDRSRALAARLQTVREEEQRRLARELHDEVGQLLTGLRLLLKPNRDLPAEAIDARLEQARAIVDDLLGRVRRISFDLRPADLDQLGLLPALLALFERYTAQTAVRVNLKHQGVDRCFPPEVDTGVYRIVQEALTNAARHAGVAAVTVRVWTDSDKLNLQIEDGGRGFDPEVALKAPQSSGLIGMQERALLLGGQLTIESSPESGTTISAELPLEAGNPLLSPQPRS